MSEMVERVVASLRAKRRELIHQPLDRVWLDLARAAIEAMRRADGGDESRRLGTMPDYDPSDEDAGRCWQDMIDDDRL